MDVECIRYVKRRWIMLRIHYFILGLVLILTAACSGTDKESVDSEETQASEAQKTVAPGQETPRAATGTKKSSTRQESTPAPPQPAYATLSAGTIIPVRLLDPLDSGVNQSGDTFRAVVDEDLMAGNKIAVPRGSEVEGKLTYVERSGRVKGRAKISLQFVSLRVGSSTYPLQTEILSFEAEGTKKEDATKVGVGSGIGAVIGAIAGGGKGAAIGAAVGAGAGGATVAATRGKELQFAAEDSMQFTLNQDVKIRTR
jgi:hypothetical protein